MLESGICLGVYLLSVFLAWRFAHLTYSKGGQEEGRKPDNWDLVHTLFPVWNTICALLLWSTHHPIRGERKFPKIKINYNKFFKIK